VNRREVLTGMALASASVAIPAAALANASTGSSRYQWDKAMSGFRRLHEEHEAVCVAHGAVEERYFNERPAQPLGGEFRIGDTVDSYYARLRHDREQSERLDAECRERTGFSASEAKQGLACDASWEALTELLATPAPDLQAVLLKIELATEHGREIEDLGPVLADLRRFAAGRA
jgi:hypothetical protein